MQQDSHEATTKAGDPDSALEGRDVATPRGRVLPHDGGSEGSIPRPSHRESTKALSAPDVSSPDPDTGLGALAKAEAARDESWPEWQLVRHSPDDPARAISGSRLDKPSRQRKDSGLEDKADEGNAPIHSAVDSSSEQSSSSKVIPAQQGAGPPEVAQGNGGSRPHSTTKEEQTVDRSELPNSSSPRSHDPSQEAASGRAKLQDTAASAGDSEAATDTVAGHTSSPLLSESFQEGKKGLNHYNVQLQPAAGAEKEISRPEAADSDAVSADSLGFDAEEGTISTDYTSDVESLTASEFHHMQKKLGLGQIQMRDNYL